MSPAGKPGQCTHVRLSTTLSSPSTSATYSTVVSVIAYTSRSLRTSPGILDLEENRTANLIFNWTERWDKEGDTDLVCGVSESKLNWALITHRGNEDFSSPYFLYFCENPPLWDTDSIKCIYWIMYKQTCLWRCFWYDLRIYWLLWSRSFTFLHCLKWVQLYFSVGVRSTCHSKHDYSNNT